MDRQGRAQAADLAAGPAAGVRFLRHLAAAPLVVAAVVLLALAWNHVAGGTVGAVRQGPDVRIVMAARAPVRRLAEHVPARHPDR